MASVQAKSEINHQILLPYSEAEGRMIGIQALKTAYTQWSDARCRRPAFVGMNIEYRDRWGAVGFRIANLLLDEKKTDEVEHMLGLFIDDGSMNNTRDRALALYGNHMLQEKGIIFVAPLIIMITSYQIRELFLNRCLLYAATTPWGEHETQMIWSMLQEHVENMESPGWGKDRETERHPQYDFERGKNHPALSSLASPQTCEDLEELNTSLMGENDVLTKLELMTSLTEHLLTHNNTTDTDVIMHIKAELNALAAKSDLGGEILSMRKGEIPDDSVYSWINILHEAHRLTKIGVIATSGSSVIPDNMNELLSGEKIWDVVAKKYPFSAVLAQMLKNHISGIPIEQHNLEQGLIAYGIGDGQTYDMITAILTGAIPKAEMSDEQWTATASRLVSYIEGVHHFTQYDKTYMDIEESGQQLILARITRLTALCNAIGALPPDARNRALLSFYRFGPDKTREISTYSFEWRAADIHTVLMDLESLPTESVGAYLKYQKHTAHQ